ncbi:hypothetical protein Tsubulata_051050 [Turnera subulata]|uniref:Uncharacterized protein n=1 Tax=Turnera subulata TaxID=218843 RepID=A0A9Q0J4W3_9ROSI|nr:hypothetical protein Tsubulata_051050 [Turnera subulata]
MEVSPTRASSRNGADEDGWDNARDVNCVYLKDRLKAYESYGPETWEKIVRYLEGMRESEGFDVEHLEHPMKPFPLVRPMSLWKNHYKPVMLQAAQSAIACFNAKMGKKLLLFEVVKANIRVIYSTHPEFFMTLKTLDTSSLLMETYLAKVLSSTSVDRNPQPEKDKVKTFKRKKEHDDTDDDDDPFAYEVCRSCCRDTDLVQALDQFNSSRPKSNSNGKTVRVRLGHPYHGCRIRLCIEACEKRVKKPKGEKSGILGLYDVQVSLYLTGPDATHHLYWIVCLGRDTMCDEYLVRARVVFNNKDHAVSEIPECYVSNPSPPDR